MLVAATKEPKSLRYAGGILGFSWRLTWRSLPIAVALAAAALLAVSSVREPLLTAAGAALVFSEPAEPADIIVISSDSGGAGALQASDLVYNGIATRVAVFTDPPSGEDLEFIRRGLPSEDQAARQIRRLAWLGMTNVTKTHVILTSSIA
jgi:hypothetical protein